MRDLDDAGLHELQAVAGAGLKAEDDRIGGAGHIGLGLADADGLDQHDVEERAHQHHGRDGERGEAAELVPRRHGAHEDAGIAGIGPEPRAVAEQRSAGGARGRVDGDDADGAAVPAPGRDERADQRRLADAGRTGDAHHLRARRRIGRIEQPQRRRVLRGAFEPGERRGERRLPSRRDGREGLAQAVVSIGCLLSAACAAASRAIGTR